MIGLDDRGLTLGDGLFETLLAVDGALRRAPAHLARLAAGCEVLGLPAPDPEAALGLMDEALTAAGLRHRRAAVRLTLSAGGGGRGLERPPALSPRMFATAAPAPAPTGPARLITSRVRRNEGSPASRLKTLAYLDNVLARREALVVGGDEALMLNNAGEVACAAAANVFWVAGGRLFTPDLGCGALAGIMRAAVIEAAANLGAPVAQTRSGPAELAGAEAVFLTNSLIGVRRAASLDGRALGRADIIDALARAVG